jgi:UDP-N-acetylglucosamine 1-carboxyvinyltransferase
MIDSYLEIEQSLNLNGEIELFGAKNAVLVTMASLLLTNGVSILSNVPASSDILHMISLLEELGAQISFNMVNHTLVVDTTSVNKWCVSPSIMKKMRASILVMGPLLARFTQADIALPGGCIIGPRPINYHLKAFAQMGVEIEFKDDFLKVHVDTIKPARIVLEYPSVGATENIMMLAVTAPGTTHIINAAIEPEVMDLVSALKKMGAHIEVQAPATIVIEGVRTLHPIEHEIMPDRLEAGALLLAAAVTKGEIYLPQAQVSALDVFLLKLEQMGHTITTGSNGIGIRLKATDEPRAVSFKTGPFPSFPTDLQAPMMVAQCVAQGTSVIEETVFENRLLHVRELEKMGAQIKVEYTKATINGVDELFGTQVIASDIRASCALVLAGMIAHGSTILTGIQHWRRGYEGLEDKLIRLGGRMHLRTANAENAAVFKTLRESSAELER